MIRYLRDPKCPDWHPGRQPPTRLDAHQAFVGQWVAAGGRNSADLHRQLRAKGCRASYDAVRRYLNRKIGSCGRPGWRAGPTKVPVPPAPSARKLSFAFIAQPQDKKPSDDLSEALVLLDRVRARAPALDAGLDLAADLARMLRKRVSRTLADWLARAEASGVADLVNFAAGLRQDETAVAAALTEPWSNGQAEGQVNRLKVIKRMMYGRAGLPLLRARVCRKG